ncbi:hypothetical protein ACIBO9_28080 [Streptomyces prunicolor]|uniref:hypothetical protein n=1 Tax=Streptomyces prunicolor TaxID=67348 RepID=UPI0037D492BB
MRVGVLFVFEGELGAGRDQLGERFIVADFAYGFVVQDRGGADECVGHRGAGERAVDEESAGSGGALQAAVFLCVVGDELVAQAAGRDCEVGRELIGVGAVGGQQSGRRAEAVGGEPGQGVHRVRAGAFAGGEQDQAEGELGWRLTRSPARSVPSPWRRPAATRSVAECPKMPSSAPPQ